ncbi:MAG: Nramp family divalent metal transporter [Saprospiraceae bacterium]|nr:Nramp family divalent metal transporter [Saprospiraceae bacterium]
MTAGQYTYEQQHIASPPANFWSRLKYLGPGFILSASIVGSGELIATTTLGARAGFVTFWVIIISCLIKVMLQIEFAKHTILSGKTPMQVFNRMPGMRIKNSHWSVWFFFILMLTKMLQLGGIIGGVAIILNMSFPSISITLFAILLAPLVALLIYRGYYQFIEKFSLLMIGLFTIFTFICLIFLKYTPYAITADQIWQGLQFQLPPAAVAVAIGAFGITGVGGDEIIAYNYWCLEKGYASKTGINNHTDAWEKRARGWIRVMQLDAVAAMIVYTVMTAAFYLLGAAVLHASGDLPEGYAMIESLSRMYTESLGPGAKVFFMLGAFMVLFSTLFAALAAWTRQFSDVFGQLGWIDFFDNKERAKSIAILSWTFPFLWSLIFIFIKLPVAMVIAGGIITSIILLLVIWVIIHLRYKQLPSNFKPKLTYDLLLWISIVVTIAIAVYGLVQIWA